MDMDNEDNIDNGEYYIVRKKAVPQVLVDVVRDDLPEQLQPRNS